MATVNDVDARKVAGYAAAAQAAYGDYDMVNDPAGLGRRWNTRGTEDGRWCSPATAWAGSRRRCTR